MSINDYDFDGDKERCLASKYFVTATDKMFCACPLWPGKNAKLIIACDTYEQAYQVWEKMKYKRGNKGYYLYVSIAFSLPSYAKSRYAVKVMRYDRATAFH